MAFPDYATVSPGGDDANRADENPIAGNWVSHGGAGLGGPLKIVSNQILGAGSVGSWCGSYWDKEYKDCEIFCTIATYVTDSIYYLKLRMLPYVADTFPIPDPAQNCYQCIVGESAPGTWDLKRKDNGSDTTLAQVTGQAALASGDSIGFSIIGNVLTGYRKTGAGAWTAVPGLTDTDDTYAQGYPGMVVHDPGTTVRLDNFGFGGILADLDSVLPDADVVTTGWTTTPLYSKINDASDSTVIQATAV